MENKEMINKEKKDDKIPKSLKSQNTYKDFIKICRAYYDELMHISKNGTPSLSKKDITILNDIIHEISNYSDQLLKANFIQEAKKLLDTGLVITDFFLKVFGEISESNKNDTNENKLSDKLKFPLSLKLLLLKANFNILINYENDYENSEKNLNEIIEIQLYIKSSNYHLASSKFHMAKIKFFFKNYDEAKKYALDAKNLFESNNSEKNKNSNQKEEEIIEKKITQNVSNILSFLAQIFLIQKDYKNAASCYENGYYLNLGRYGTENSTTEYFKNKLDLINEDQKKHPVLFQPKTQMIMNQTGQNNSTSNSNINYIGNILHKGKAETFSFKIPTSSLYEPFLLSIYRIGEDDNNRYASELFLGNLCFDKQKLAKYLKLRGTNYNSMFYTDENLNNILVNIKVVNGILSFLDKNLKSSLISSSCSMNKK